MALVAFIAADTDALPETAAAAAEQVEHWQTVWDEQTYAAADEGDAAFNLAGWNSSYTGRAIGEEPMREWVDETVARILSWRPRRVLEIGCGTGLLLGRIAPHVEHYLATDFSRRALEKVQRHLPPEIASRVELRHCTAHDLTGIETAFDTIVINSVVQYFPSASYLEAVIDGALRALAPGGVLFIGDVRNLRLLDTFHAWAELQAAGDVDRLELEKRTAERASADAELVLDPDFFHAIAEREPRVREVRIELRRGRFENELTQFRYDAILRVDSEAPARAWRAAPASAVASAAARASSSRAVTPPVRTASGSPIRAACPADPSERQTAATTAGRAGSRWAVARRAARACAEPS
jgi:SAM-dependent methyltransferase